MSNGKLLVVGEAISRCAVTSSSLIANSKLKGLIPFLIHLGAVVTLTVVVITLSIGITVHFLAKELISALFLTKWLIIPEQV